MKPTIPTAAPAVAPVVVQTAPTPAAVVEPAVDWRALALDLLAVIETRPSLQVDMLAVVNRVRAAAGMSPRVAAPVSIGRVVGGAPVAVEDREPVEDLDRIGDVLPPETEPN